MSSLHDASIWAAIISSILSPGGMFWLNQRAARARETREAQQTAARDAYTAHQTVVSELREATDRQQTKKLELDAVSDEAVRKELWEEVRGLRKENVDIRKSMLEEANKCRQTERDAGEMRLEMLKLSMVREDKDRCERMLAAMQVQIDELKREYLGSRTSG